MTQEEFITYMAKIKAERILLEKLILKIRPDLKQTIEDFKNCIDRAAEKNKVNKEKL